VIHVQKKTKGLLLKNIVRTVKKSYAQNTLNGICGVSESKEEFLTSFEAKSKGKTDSQDLWLSERQALQHTTSCSLQK
jgi:hypothetical protein